MAELDNIASQLLKSASEADRNYAKTRDQSQKDKATRLRVIVQNLQNVVLGASDLNGLSDVTLTSPTNAQLLVYNSTSGQWVNQNPAVVSTPTLAQVTTAGNTTTNAVGIGVGVGDPLDFQFVVQGVIQVRSGASSFSGLRIDSSSIRRRDTGTFSLGTNDSTSFNIFAPTNNIGIGTTTDAGYKLDVNGTARVSDTATIAKALNITGTVAVTGTGTTYANTFSSNINGTFSGATIATLSVNEAGFSGTGSGIQNYAIVAGSSVFSKLTVNSQSTFTDSTAAQLRVQGYNVLTGASGNFSGTLLFTQTTSGGFLGLAATYGGGGSRISIFNQYNDGVTNSTSQVKVNIAGTDIAIFAGSGELAIGKGAALSGASLTTSTSITAASLLAQGVYFNNTLVAAANNDVLVGLDINPTFTNGAFTGVTNVALRTQTGNVLLATTSGNVGIGTTSPTYKLQVGDSAVNGSNKIVIATLNSGLNGFYIYASSYIRAAIEYDYATSLARFIGAYNGGTNIIGQDGNNGHTLLYSGTASSERMRVVGSTGNVLINTTTDAGYKLDVNGTARFSGNTYLAGDILVSNGSGTRYIQSPNGGIGFLSSNSSGYNLWTANTGVGIKSELYISNDLNYNVGVRLRTSTTQTSPSGYGYELSFQPQVNHVPTYTAIRTLDSSYGGNSTTPSPIHIFGGQNTTSGTYAHVVLQSDFTGERGNVGVGTISPAYKFHISSAAAANIYGTVQSTNANGTAAWVAFNDQSDNVVYRVFGSGASGTQMGIALARSASLIANLGGAGSFLLGTYSATNFIMGTGNAEKMRIVDSTGNILIATTTDLGNKLEVNGNINSTGYKINNTAGYTGILVIVTNPPGQQNIDIRGGIIVNVF